MYVRLTPSTVPRSRWYCFSRVVTSTPRRGGRSDSFPASCHDVNPATRRAFSSSRLLAFARRDLDTVRRAMIGAIRTAVRPTATKLVGRRTYSA